ncbi:MAG TPA: hypothetical protein DCZ88_12035 [Pseudanabaena sp.]|nr:hypothetical protein [Pseudanabaena sp.]
MELSNSNISQTIWTDRILISHKTRSPISQTKQRSPLTPIKPDRLLPQHQTAIATNTHKTRSPVYAFVL